MNLPLILTIKHQYNYYKVTSTSVFPFFSDRGEANSVEFNNTYKPILYDKWWFGVYGDDILYYTKSQEDSLVILHDQYKIML